MKITEQQYAKTLLELTENKSEQDISAVVKKFAEVLQRDGQLKNSKKIIEKFSDFYNKEHGIVETEVTSKEALSGELRSQVSDYVSARYQAKEVILKNTVDEKIQGGIIIKVGNEILDASISNQLRILKNILIK